MFAFLGGETRNWREVLDRLEVSGGGRVLKVSIGPGVNRPYRMGAPGARPVFGLDISPGQVRQCQRLCRHGWSVDLCLANVEQLPFRDDSFDCVSHIGGINFFNDKRTWRRCVCSIGRGCCRTMGRLTCRVNCGRI